MEEDNFKTHENLLYWHVVLVIAEHHVVCPTIAVIDNSELLFIAYQCTALVVKNISKIT